ncbi:MAG: transposase zinc-binding domain-containing protein [Myxococcota bacterium]
MVPLSCRGRSLCASCTGRRMADTAARLTDQVFPSVPVRHWTLSLPFPLHYIVAFDADLMSAILGIFVR